MQLPNLNGVRNASDNLKGVSIVTPLELNERLSAAYDINEKSIMINAIT